MSVAAVRGISASEHELVDDEWLAKLSRRMLSVNSPLDVSTLRGGLCRACTSHGVACVPPVSALADLYGNDAAFGIDGGFHVRARYELDYRVELPGTDQLFVDIFRSSWTGVLDHDSFRDACVSSGMSPRVFEACASHSAVLHDGPGDIWFLRGTRVSAITAAALRFAKGMA
jgi:hypothetical protein